jgi:hypothetical protein
MTGDFNPGGYDTLNRAPLAEAKAVEAGVPRRQPVDAPRWADPGTVVRAVGLVLLLIVIGGWVLTLLSGS